MTAKTLEGALALEAAAGRSRLADAYREGAEAMREAAARIAGEHSTAQIAAHYRYPPGSVEHDSSYAAGQEAGHLADRIRSLPIPEYKP